MLYLDHLQPTPDREMPPTGIDGLLNGTTTGADDDPTRTEVGVIGNRTKPEEDRMQSPSTGQPIVMHAA